MPNGPPGKKPRRRLSAEERRALQMLATSGQSGVTVAILLAHGFSTALFDEMAQADLVIVATGAVRAGDRMIEVARLRITDAGREAIQDA